jgi:hypothetical protein
LRIDCDLTGEHRAPKAPGTCTPSILLEKTDPTELIVKADEQDKPATPRPTHDGPRHPAAFHFRPAVVVLPDSNGEVDPTWLAQTQSTLPGRYLTAFPGPDTELECLPGAPRCWSEVIAAAAGVGAVHGAVIIESGLRFQATSRNAWPHWRAHRHAHR